MRSRWNIDEAKSRVGFTVRHMMISKVHGSFSRWKGDLEIDRADLSLSLVSIAIDAASVDTADKSRDDYLRWSAFLDVDHHPHITFRSARIEKKSQKAYLVRGDLVIRDVSRAVTLATEVDGAFAAGGGSRLVCKATTRIDRRDFNLQWSAALEAGGLLVADAVDISIELVATPADPNS